MQSLHKPCVDTLLVEKMLARQGASFFTDLQVAQAHGTGYSAAATDLRATDAYLIGRVGRTFLVAVLVGFCLLPTPRSFPFAMEQMLPANDEGLARGHLLLQFLNIRYTSVWEVVLVSSLMWKGHIVLAVRAALSTFDEAEESHNHETEE